MSGSNRWQLPFVWLARQATWFYLVLIVGIAAFFRFYQLSSLPPGLYDSSAQTGLQALDLLNHSRIPGLDAANGFAPIWVWLQAGSIKLFGHTELALRIWPAALGTLAILTTWLWVRSWFRSRVAMLAAFLLAVTPWAVTMSRNTPDLAALPLLVTLTLWLATVAYRKAGAWNYLALALALALDLAAGPVGWLIAATVIVLGLVALIRDHKLASINRGRILGLSVLAASLALLTVAIVKSLAAVRTIPKAGAFASSLQSLGSNILHTLLMFNTRVSDDNFRHNLPGEPLLNAFVGLMLVAGIIVAISRLYQRRYRFLFALLIVLLLPAFISNLGTSNAAHAVAAMPIILTFAAIGTAYMLELWYATFPINSAARTTGQLAIIILLALTLFQGYTQYFRAWAGSSQVYAAYNEGAVQLAHNLATDKFAGQRFVVAPPDQQSIVAYLDYSGTTYQPLAAKAITGLPVAGTPREFLITADSRDAATSILKTKFPGGVLRPHYSSFNQTEIYYSYEIAK